LSYAIRQVKATVIDLADTIFGATIEYGYLRAGRPCEVEFADELSGESEWMWVLVDRSDNENRIVFGRLDSEPVITTNLRTGSELAISYDKIRGHRRFNPA
jgi:hypothetical protein